MADEMALSPIWQELPGDMAEQILSQVVACHFDSDPAYTWVTLRQLSGHQKRVIEHRFGQFWLPKLSFTLYSGTRHKFDYVIDHNAPTPLGDKATFVIQRQVHNPLLGISQDSMPGQVMRQHVKDAWAKCDSEPARNVTVRLGEGYLGGGCRGGYILNDTDLPGREILERGIRFLWKDAMHELLREEMYMRKVGDELFADACKEWCADNAKAAATEDKVAETEDAAITQEKAAASKDTEKPQLTPLRIQVKIWRSHVQSARRVAARKHRAAKSQTTSLPIKLKFAATSVKLHRQEPDPESLKAMQSWDCCAGCSRTEEPDIFEVAMVEESAVPRLEVFQRWITQQWQPDTTDREVSGGSDQTHASDYLAKLDTILSLYRDEFAWTCQHQSDGIPEESEQEPEEQELEATRSRTSRDYARRLLSILNNYQRVRWQLAP